MAESEPTGPRAPAAPHTVDVLMPVALDTAYSYAVPPGLALAPGDVVAVPFGRKQAVGVVWGASAGARRPDLKTILGRVDVPPLPEGLRRFVEWIAHYTLTPRGLALRAALRLPDATAPETPRIGVRATGLTPARMTPARARVIAAAADGLLHPKRALALAAGVSPGVIDGLVDDGVLEPMPLPASQAAAPPDPDHATPTLSEAQAEAARALAAAVTARRFGVQVLEGVTGSGKTEVYFEAAAAALRAGRQALILVPEIALTAPFLDRFAARFGVRPAEWHSAVTGRRRDRIHTAVASGEAKVVAGARSALFLPFRDLGLVVVDEEHEAAYKQEDVIPYHARDMAVVRARLEGAACVLASATPSIETRVNAEQGRYARLVLPDRFGGRRLPGIRAIDLRRDRPPAGHWLSQPLVEAMRERLAAGEQALLFLNRRGYAPLTLCRACGHRFQCPDCTAWLVEHRFSRSLRCHHCGHREPKPHACPACGAIDELTACGPGVERLAEEVAGLFPDKRAIVLSSDMPGGTERLRRELAEIAEGSADIVIGTQLVAKGHNFPLLTLVGVVDADLGLMNGDPRAAERTFQILQQVAGRAGRGDRPGLALLQTHDPSHPVLAALVSGDQERFYAEEIAARRRAGLPPFGRMAALVVSATDRGSAETHARALARAALSMPGVRGPLSHGPGDGAIVLGPAEAPIAVVRGRHRFRLLVKTPRAFDLQRFLRDWLAAAPRPSGSLRVAVDVDPQSFL